MTIIEFEWSAPLMFIEARVKKSINLTRFNRHKQIRTNELIGSSLETKCFSDKSPTLSEKETTCIISYNDFRLVARVGKLLQF